MKNCAKAQVAQLHLFTYINLLAGVVSSERQRYYNQRSKLCVRMQSSIENFDAFDHGTLNMENLGLNANFEMESRFFTCQLALIIQLSRTKENLVVSESVSSDGKPE